MKLYKHLGPLTLSQIVIIAVVAIMGATAFFHHVYTISGLAVICLLCNLPGVFYRSDL